MPTFFVNHPYCLKHLANESHPESPKRLAAIEFELKSRGLWHQLAHREGRLASEKEVALVHPSAYHQQLKQIQPQQGHISLDQDTLLGPESMTSAHAAVGTTLIGTELVLEHQGLANAFCCTRPPGHHAEPDQAMGFCLLNSVAIAVKYALKEYSLKRVAVIDFDVHYGNGIISALKEDERVMVISSYETPLYPYTALPVGYDNLVNTPLKAGSHFAIMEDAMIRQWIPALQKFQPEALFISAGFDAHRLDQQSHLSFSSKDYYYLGKYLVQIAANLCQGKIIASLEGGYHLQALAESSAYFIQSLLEGGSHSS